MTAGGRIRLQISLRRTRLYWQIEAGDPESFSLKDTTWKSFFKWLGSDGFQGPN